MFLFKASNAIMKDTTNKSENMDPILKTDEAIGNTEPGNTGAETPPNEEEGAPVANAGDTQEEGNPPTYEELQSDIAALKDQLLRAMAEAENVRRRTEREKADASKYAVTNFARAILSVADNLTRALESVPAETRATNEDLENLYVGIEMTSNELENVYEQFGIKPIEALGKKFDHNFHQAMFEVEDPEKPAGLVVEQVQKGYMLQDRLLRAAMVGVSKGGAKPDEPPVANELSPEPEVDSPIKKSTAYEKQADAADKEGTNERPKVDKKL